MLSDKQKKNVIWLPTDCLIAIHKTTHGMRFPIDNHRQGDGIFYSIFVDFDFDNTFEMGLTWKW